jgi:hypothetical protein
MQYSPHNSSVPNVLFSEHSQKIMTLLLSYAPFPLSIAIFLFYASKDAASATGFAALQEWERAAHRKTSSIFLQPSGGLGNRLTGMISAGILAFYFNKPISCDRCDQRFFDWKVRAESGMGWAKFPDIPNLYSSTFHRDDPRSFDMWFLSPDHLYLHHQIGKVLYKAFGEYAIYFIGNYFLKFPPEIQSRVDRLMETIPKTVITIGVHIRTHFTTGVRMYMYDIPQGCELIARFIEKQWGTQTYQLLIATDCDRVHAYMKRRFPACMKSGAVAFPDGDQDSAAIDFKMMQSCKELILTYRSTFSILLSALLNRTGYYYAAEFPTLVKFACSQVGMTSPVYQQAGIYNDQLNSVRHVRDEHEDVMRVFYKYSIV